MKDTRFQLRIDPVLKERVTLIARQRHTTVAALVTQFLQRLVESDRLERCAGDVEQI